MRPASVPALGLVVALGCAGGDRAVAPVVPAAAPLAVSVPARQAAVPAVHPSSGEVTWVAETSLGERVPLMREVGGDETGETLFPAGAVKACHRSGLDADPDEAGWVLLRVVTGELVDSRGLSKLTVDCVVRAVLAPTAAAVAPVASEEEAPQTLHVYVGLK
jgi:hypothetical protein